MGWLCGVIDDDIFLMVASPLTDVIILPLIVADYCVFMSKDLALGHSFLHACNFYGDGQRF